VRDVLADIATNMATLLILTLKFIYTKLLHAFCECVDLMVVEKVSFLYTQCAIMISLHSFANQSISYYLYSY
jgi:hypothetical protein